MAKMDQHDPAYRQRINVHWRRQARFCGLETLLPYFDTVEQLDKQTARSKVVQMLKSVGVEQVERLENFEILFPPPGVVGGVTSRSDNPFGTRDVYLSKAHTTGTDAKVARYLNDTIATATLVDHYIEDYMLFGIKAPSWAVTKMLHRPPHRTHYFEKAHPEISDA